MMRAARPFVLVASCLACSLAGPRLSQASDAGDAVVKISVTQREPDFFRPWTKASPKKISGSGAVIAGGRILTNAHVVMYASEIFVQLRKGGDQHPAKVIAIAPGIDLAMIELKDPNVLESITPLSLADALPEPKSQVSTYGYPTGGDDLSITNGIISRIEFTSYNFGASGLRIQVDAALNPGNSGGPAIQDGKIIGLGFSGLREADNIGYVIPAEEIQTFMTDASDGHYDGKPMLFESFQTAENDAIRAYLKLDKDATGVIVVEPMKTEDNPIKPWDVITHIGPHAIDNQGYVDVREGLRLKFQYYVPKLTEKGAVELTVWRDGKSEVIRVPVKPDRDLLVPALKDGYPDYFIYGPLVFSAATQEYLQRLGPSGIAYLAALDSPIIQRMDDPPAEPGEQIVILASRMFPHPITKGYDSRPLGVIGKMNGEEVKNLKHLAQLLRDCKDEYVRLEMADRSESLIFRREELAKSTEEILTDEGIRFQASESLRDVFDK